MADAIVNPGRMSQGPTAGVGDPARHLFVAAGGGGDVLAATILQRALYGDGRLPRVVTYSWDRLMVDPEPGPRDPSWFENLRRVGDHNFVVSSRSSVRQRGGSLLPRLASELDTSFYLFDPSGGAIGMRAQLAELVALLEIEQVSLVDSGGDILAAGTERGLRSPLADSLALAAADGIGAPVDVLVAGAGLDGELSPSYVCDVVDELRGEIVWRQLQARDVEAFAHVLRWHPSEVNGLLIVSAQGFEGTVEIRAMGIPVKVDASSAAVHRCAHSAVLARNAIATSMAESGSLGEAEEAMVRSAHFSEMDHQRENAKHYGGEPLPAAQLDACLARLERYGETREGVDALTLRRAAEVMGIFQAELEALGPEMRRRYSQRFRPPLWMVPERQRPVRTPL